MGEGYVRFELRLQTLLHQECASTQHALTPWCVLQLLGFSDIVTGAIGTCTMVGAAIGFWIGGGAGD